MELFRRKNKNNKKRPKGQLDILSAKPLSATGKKKILFHLLIENPLREGHIIPRRLIFDPGLGSFSLGFFFFFKKNICNYYY